MAQFFVICTTSVGDEPGQNTTTEERNQITRTLEKKGWQVWHWFEDLWLAVNPKAVKISCDTLLTELRRKCPLREDCFILITEVKPKDLAGFGPELGWKWTENNWPGKWGDN